MFRLFKSIIKTRKLSFNREIADDYGVSKLTFNYRKVVDKHGGNISRAAKEV